MLRKIKTNLTKADLQKPALNIDDAVTSDAGTGSSTGALFLPEDKKISSALSAAPVVSKSDDWMKKGDPTAPALRDLEERARLEREAAMQAATANTSQVADPMTGAATIADPTATPIPQEAIVDGRTDAGYQPPSTARFPWVANAEPSAPVIQDNLDSFAADMGIPFGEVPAGAPVAQPTPKVPMVVTYSDKPGAPYPESSIQMPEPVQPDEMVLHIPHNQSELSANIASQQSPARAETIIGNSPEKPFAAGGAVRIPHDDPMSSLPYSPAKKEPYKTDSL